MVKGRGLQLENRLRDMDEEKLCKILQNLHITLAIFIDGLFEESSIISDWPISFKFKKFIKNIDRLIFIVLFS